MPLTDNGVESGDFQEVGETNFQQIRSKASKIGYADGVADGRENVFQKGFDQGYKDGLHTSFEIDKFRHFFQNLNMDKLSDNNLQVEKDEFDRLKIKESKSADHFQYLKHKEESLDFVSERQQKYVNEIIDQYAQKMPRTSAALLKTLESKNVT